MCKVLMMTRQNYYKYRNTMDKDYNDYLEIKRVFEEGKELYGAIRIKKALAIETGWIINLKKVYPDWSIHLSTRSLINYFATSTKAEVKWSKLWLRENYVFRMESVWFCVYGLKMLLIGQSPLMILQSRIL